MRRWSFLLVMLSASGCPKAGGDYASSNRQTGLADRGEVNGRMFDFVSNKPEDDDWQVRIRGTSMWASYSTGDTTDDLGTTNITSKESAKLWRLVDELELSERKPGKKDEDEGYVLLRLREPGGEEGHDIYTVYVSRATEDDDVLAVAEYLRALIGKYHKEKPNF